jgi:biopolymer transport protein ExbB
MHELLGGIEFIDRGGFMMYPLLVSALAALVVIIERLYIFSKRYKLRRSILQKMYRHVEAGQIEQARQLCQKKELRNPVCAVFGAGLEHFNSPIEEMELAMKNRAEEWVPRFEKRIELLDTVITAAPLMGLLGTITGMMASFRVLSEKGVNEPNAITGGVAEALIATATGLVIALCCLVAYNYISARIKVLIYQLESVASRLVELRMQQGRSVIGSEGK